MNGLVFDGTWKIADRYPRRYTGRKRLDLSVQNVLDAVRHSGSITTVAEELGCSRATVYRLLKIGYSATVRKE